MKSLNLIFLLLVLSNVAHADDKAAQVERGRYLVTTMMCNDCHTPLHMTENGPEPDWSRMLSGHPASLVVDTPPMLGGPWMAAASQTMTAWAGPWGISYTANLTPDPDTGLGYWTVDEFVRTLRTGRHLGSGRPILPPMPYQMIGQLNDEDLHAMFAYLQSIPPIRNDVPEPVAPAGASR